MLPMFVTLEVSKLSGWLNAVAICRVERRACYAGRDVRAGRRKTVGWRQAACTGRTRLKAGAQGTRGTHRKHGVHVCDLERVDAQRLVERHRVLPSRKEDMRCGARCAGREAGRTRRPGRDVVRGYMPRATVGTGDGRRAEMLLSGWLIGLSQSVYAVCRLG